MSSELLTLAKCPVLKPYQSRAFKPYTLMSDADIQHYAGETLVFDTESYANFFLICMKHLGSRKVIKFEINAITGECINERKLSWIMHSYTTIGFNSNKFDIPLVWLCYHTQELATLKNACNYLIRENYHKSAFESEFHVTVHPTRTIDLIEVCPLRGSLKLYGARLHAQRIQDIPFDPDSRLIEHEIEVVSDYCLNDLDITELLYKNLSEQLQLRTELSIEYKQDLMSKSDAQIAEAVIGSELKRLTGYWPKKPSEFATVIHYQKPDFISFQTPALNRILDIICQATYSLTSGYLEMPKEVEGLKIHIGKAVYRIGNGGLHSSEKNIAHTDTLYDRDVASYYPAIILNCELYPQHLGKNFLLVYRSIVERRLTAKKAKQISISECLKITINGTFGKLGSPYSILYAPDLMLQVTVTGQLALLMLIEKLELCSISVVSANTDGILINCTPSEKEQMLSIIQQWEQKTGFQTEESQYTQYYARDVNAYIAIKADNSIKGKNYLYDPWRGKTGRDGYWRFQKNPQAQICVEAIERLLIDQISIDNTIKNCNDITKFLIVKNVTGGAHKDGSYLGKVVRWYWSKTPGTINYIKSGNKVPDSDWGLPCMDLPEQLPDDINYELYIRKATEILYEINYLKKEQQISFF